MPDEQALCHNALPSLYRKTPKTARLAFISAFLGGMLVYLFALTNLMISEGDALTNVVFGGNGVWLGRWSSAWLSSLSTDYSMPLINGLLMITAISLLAAFVAAFLRFKSSFCAVLCGLTLICFPSVGDMLKYLPYADGFMIAAMLAVLSLLLVDNLRGGWALIAVPVLVLAIGTYQANAALVIALMFVRAVLLIVDGELDNKALFARAVRYIVYFTLSLALYYVLVGVFSRASGIPLSEYQSVSRMGQFSLGTLWSNFLGCYADFKKYITFLSFRPDYYVNGYANYLYAAICVGLTGLVYLLACNKTALKSAVLAALMLLSPMLLCSIRLFNPDAVHSLMVYGVTGMYLLGLALIERIPVTLKRLEDVKPQPFFAKPARFIGVASSWALVACLAVCLFVWSVGSNLDFFRGKLEYENMYSQCSSYLARAESAEGYSPDMPIYVIGDIRESGSARDAVNLQAPKYFYAFMYYYLDVDMPYGIANSIDESAARLSETPEYAAMPVYPHEGCASVIDGAMVIKLSD